MASVWCKCPSIGDLFVKGVAANKSNGFAGIPMVTIQ